MLSPDMQKLSLNVGTPENKPGPFESKFRVASGAGSASRPVTRQNSMRSKGISLNIAVSPMTTPQNMPAPSGSVPGTHLRTHSAVSPQRLPLHELTEFPKTSEDLKYDVPLPQMDLLVSMDIDDQMRLLALKEMCIVEIKDSITNLNSKLARHELELHKLREVIQKSLYKELSSSSPAPSTQRTRHQRQNSNPREEAIASTKRLRRRTLSASNPQPVAPQPTAPDRNSKIWSNLSKPLNLIQQFDTMLQNEFEKSLTPQDQIKASSHKPRLSEDSISRIGSTSPLKAKSRSLKHADLDQYFPQSNDPESRKDDMLQTVSSSIWSFVNDVKSNVLSSLSEEEFNGIKERKPEMSYNLDTGSTISLTDDTTTKLDPDTAENSVENNSDYDDLFEPVGDDDEEKIDLSIYSGMRRK